MIDPDAPLHIGMAYGVVGTLAFEAAAMVVLVWVVPAVIAVVQWARGR
jgi:hypothetical protein